MLSLDWYRAIDECYQGWQPEADLLTAFLIYQPATSPTPVTYQSIVPAFSEWIPNTEAIRQLATRGYPESFLNFLQRWRPSARILHVAGAIPGGCPILAFQDYRSRIPLFRYHLRRWLESTPFSNKDVCLLLSPDLSEQQLWDCPDQQTWIWDFHKPIPRCRPLLLWPEELVADPIVLNSAVSIPHAPPMEVAEILQL